MSLDKLDNIYISGEISIQELSACFIMRDCFLPILHKKLKNGNPELFKKWNGNCCRQTAIFGIAILEDILPSYEFVAWQGVFEDIVKGMPVKYDHAWILAKNKTSSKRLLIDFARNPEKRNIFMEVTANKYPIYLEDYKDMKLTVSDKINVENSMSINEYFTRRPGHELVSEIKREMITKMLHRIIHEYGQGGYDDGQS